jgi:transcriptional regulator with XRE-family HTH domain
MEATWFYGRLRELREAAGLSREQLAESAGVKPSAVRDIEQGVYSPNWETVVSLCRALGVRADAFLQPPADRPPQGPGRPRKATANSAAEVPPPQRKAHKKKTAGRRKT